MNEQSHKNIPDGHKRLSVSIHYNHSINDLRCAMLNGNFTTTADRQLCEQKLKQDFTPTNVA